MGQLYTFREAAELLKCSKAHLSHIINGKVYGLPPLPVVRIGRRILVRQDALQRWIECLEESAAEALRVARSVALRRKALR